MVDINLITGDIVDAAIHIHYELGPGLYESVYETLLAHDLRHRGYDVRVQVPISFVHRGIAFENGFVVDMIVANSVVVEIKSRERIGLLEEKQLRTYLKLLDYRAGLLLNFGAPFMKQGIKRVVNRI
jgi:GxxExxY protein